ncbi:M48 family metalloprotease [Natronosalvus caseinilyticus]|uniref:M48 family metalloprotease n=1 Tax=Natronosalvus caseinilyticus TaxID=2953747 RepID=UPI0028AFEA24|nr:M48 family metalloprotease [Natronosalvus caseinilyticus]
MPSDRLVLSTRMAVSVVALAAVTVAFLAGVWLIFYGALLAAGFGGAAPIAGLVTVATLLCIGFLEYHQRETIERMADAHPVDREAAPELYRVATRVAAQLDVPAPAIAVSPRSAPEATLVGLCPRSMHLVLSTGTLDALEDPAELEAVIAHELAHVANRDGMVMTAISLPVVLADGVRSRITAFENPGWFVVVIVPLGLVSTVVLLVGRFLTAHLSRARERAADRAVIDVTGSPAALASALARLDRSIAETPDRDLRAVSGISSLSILPLEPAELEKVMLGPEGDVEPSFWWLRARLHRLERRFFGTHPPTANRIEALSASASIRDGPRTELS